MADSKTEHYSLPVISGKAWAFDDEMRFRAWGLYVRAHPEHFTTDFIMRCATLPPQAEEALDIARRTAGDMNPDQLAFIRKTADEAGFVKNPAHCPSDCVCPGAFQEVYVASLQAGVRRQLEEIARMAGKTVGEKVFFVEI